MNWDELLHDMATLDRTNLEMEWLNDPECVRTKAVWVYPASVRDAIVENLQNAIAELTF